MKRLLILLLLVSVIGLAGCGSAATGIESRVAAADVEAATQWSVTEMTGFPEGTVVAGWVKFTSDFFFIFDGANSATTPISWTDTGFASTAVLESTDAGDRVIPAPGEEQDPSGPNLRMIIGAPETEIDVTLEGDQLTLTRGELVVVAQRVS